MRWQNGLSCLHLIEAEKTRTLALLNADPFNKEIQKKIEEIIQLKYVAENFQSALTDTPGGLDRVQLPYIPMEVNNYSVKALVDSGAIASCMSPSCAETCGIMRLIDKSYNGVARGVGTTKLLGRVHLAQIRIGSLSLPCSFDILEGLRLDLLLGSDMLKRHQTCIDLDKGALIIWDEEVPFLEEADCPKEKKDEPTLASTFGTSNGAVSGAVSDHANRSRATARSNGVPATTAALPRQPRSRPPTSHKRDIA